MINPSFDSAGWDLYLNGMKNCLDDEGLKNAANDFQRAADKGHVRAMICIGYLYARGQGVLMSQETAFSHWFQAAKKGHPHAEFLVGTCYESGSGTFRNRNYALYYWRRACEQNHSEARRELENIKSDEIKKVDRLNAFNDYMRRKVLVNKMVPYWYLVLLQPEHLGCIALGLIYLTGYGVEKNESAAAEFFSQIDSYENTVLPGLLWYIGKFMLQKNHGGRYDDLAEKFLLSAVKRKSKEALETLCKHYKNQQRFDEMFEMLFNEEEKGNEHTYRYLSSCFKYGYGTVKNESLAALYLQESKAVRRHASSLIEYVHYPTPQAALNEIQRAEEMLSTTIIENEEQDAFILSNLRLKFH